MVEKKNTPTFPRYVVARKQKIGDIEHPFLNVDARNHPDNLATLFAHAGRIHQRIRNARQSCTNMPRVRDAMLEDTYKDIAPFVVDEHRSVRRGIDDLLLGDILGGKHCPSVEECEMLADDFGLAGERRAKFLDLALSYREDFARRQEIFDRAYPPSRDAETPARGGSSSRERKR